MVHALSRCQHFPDHDATRPHAQIEAKPVDVPDVGFRRSASVRRETATQLLM
jgi:hypothetical protein